MNPDGSPQPFHFRFPTFQMTLANGSPIVRKLLPGSERRLREYRMLDEDFSQPRPVPQPSASCLLLRRSCLPDDHIFDERYPIFFNDVQLARSLSDQGLTLWVTPFARVVHDAHSSTRMLGRTGKRQYLGSVMRMLSDTEPPAKVWLYRTVVFAQNIPIRSCDVRTPSVFPSSGRRSRANGGTCFPPTATPMPLWLTTVKTVLERRERRGLRESVELGGEIGARE